MSNIFHTILYQPIFNLLIALYTLLPLEDMGIAIILLTVLIRIVLWPLSQKTIDAQKKMRELQPKIKEINEKYKDDVQKRGRETMHLYKENKANPASSCLPLLIQLPILWAMFKVFQDGFKPGALTNLYSFVEKPAMIDPLFLNISYFNLATPNIVLTVITALVQFWQMKMMPSFAPTTKTPGAKDENMQAMVNKQMLYAMPIITLIIGYSLPSGLMLYWLVSTLLMGLQQWLSFKKDAPLTVIAKD